MRFKYLLMLMFIIGGYFYLFFSQSAFGSNLNYSCPSKLIYGLPCPGCGMGRATIELFKANLINSLYYNFLCIPFTLFVIYAIYLLIIGMIKNDAGIMDKLRFKINSFHSMLLIIIVLALWAKNIINGI